MDSKKVKARIKGIYASMIIAGIACVGIYVLNLLADESTEFYSVEGGQLPRLTWDREYCPIEEPRSVGTSEDPHARMEFERLRFMDPKTGRIPDNIRSKELAFVRTLPKSDALRANNRGRAQAMASTQAITFDFEPRGPINIGGRTRAVAIDISDPTGNTILAAGVSGGMWRTTDLGKTWTKTTAPDQLPNVVSLVQDTSPCNEAIWFCGTGELVNGGIIGAPYRGDGIYQSTDYGKSWKLIPTTSDGDNTNIDNPFAVVHKLVIDTTNKKKREIYAAVLNGIVRTTNDFITWDYVLGGHTNISHYTDVAITSEGRLYAVISNGYGYNLQNVGTWTSDDGIHWDEIALPESIEPHSFEKTSIGISPSNENIVYFFRTENSGDEYNLFVYDAATKQWKVRPQEALPNDLHTQHSYNQYVAVHPTNSDIVFLGGVSLYRSMNGFRDNSTTQVIGGNPFSDPNGRLNGLYINHHVDQHAMIFFPSNPNRAITANDGGLAITDNILKSSITQDSFYDVFSKKTLTDDVTVEWDELNEGYITAQFYTLAIEKNDLLFPWIVGGMQDNSTGISKVNAPNTLWGGFPGGDGAFAQLTFNSLIYSSQYASITRYSIINDGTESGRIIVPHFDNRPDEYLFINPLLADPVIPNRVFIASRKRIYYTYYITAQPGGSDWLSFGESVLADDERVTAMDASVHPPHQLVFGTRDLGSTLSSNTGGRRVLRVENTNNPDIITDLTTDELPLYGHINAIKVDPRDANNLTVVFSNYHVISLYNSQNGGLSWTPIAGNLEENLDGSGNGVATTWLEIMPNGEDNIYLVGTSAGIYYTQELHGMNTVWTQAGASTIGNAPVNMIAVRPADGYVAVATYGNGIYQTTLDVPLQASIYLKSFPCANNSLTLYANRLGVQSASQYDLSYEWMVNGRLIDELDGSAIKINSLITPALLQAKITNEVTGETALSNKLPITPITHGFCEFLVLKTTPHNHNDDLTIFPNPVTDVLSIANLNNVHEAKFTILDLGGHTIKSGMLDTSNKISVYDLAPGTYILSISTPRTQEYKRFVKVN